MSGNLIFAIKLPRMTSRSLASAETHLLFDLQDVKNAPRPFISSFSSYNNAFVRPRDCFFFVEQQKRLNSVEISEVRVVHVHMVKLLQKSLFFP